MSFQSSFHPRVALNSISSMMQSLDDDLALWADLGMTNVGLISPKLDAPGWDVARDAVRDAGLVVSSMSCYPEELVPSIEFTAAVDSHVLYLPTGPGEPYRWDDAAAKYCEEMAPLVARAKDLDVVLAIEPTNPLRSDMSFVFTVRDAVDLARMAGTGVCVDFYSAWYERGLDDIVRKNIDVVALAQVCDFKIGTFETGNRVAIGDGDIPVERLVAMLLDAGYEGVFELEILGPVVEAEGYRAPIVRSLERMSEMLGRLGA
jgi:sugar phosphate isomerase/epimerase